MGGGGAGKGAMEGLTRSSSISAKAQLLSQDDQKRVASLESKVAEQKKEIENRDITIKAIQRNFEQLSTLCQQDKEQLQRLQKKLAEAESRVVDDATRKKAEKYPQLKEAFDSLNQSYVEAEAKIEKMRQQTVELSGSLQNLESVKKSLMQEVKLICLPPPSFDASAFGQVESGRKNLQETKTLLSESQARAKT